MMSPRSTPGFVHQGESRTVIAGQITASGSVVAIATIVIFKTARDKQRNDFFIFAFRKAT